MLSWCLNFLFNPHLDSSGRVNEEEEEAEEGEDCGSFYPYDFHYQREIQEKLLAEVEGIGRGDRQFRPSMDDIYVHMNYMSCVLKVIHI
jgi:hypothetical protein